MCGRIRKRSRRIGSPGGNDAITRSNKSRRFPDPSPLPLPAIPRCARRSFGLGQSAEPSFTITSSGAFAMFTGGRFQSGRYTSTKCSTIRDADRCGNSKFQTRQGASFRAKSRMEWLGSRDMDREKRKAERTGSEQIKSRRTIQRQLNGILRLRCASLGMTVLVWDGFFGVWSFLAKKRNERIHSLWVCSCGNPSLPLNCASSSGALAQLVRAPPCHGGGCGFEPRRLRGNSAIC